MGAGKLLIRFILGVIIASLLGVGIGTRVSAAPGTTIQGTLTLFTAIENIAVISSFTGDDNGNNRAILEYRLKGAAEWKPGIEMTADRRQAVISYYHGGAGGGTPQPNPYPNSWKAVIFWLTPNTEYEVRVTYSDPDGVAGSNPVIGTIRTRNDNPPSNGKKYFVSTTGNDSNDGLGPQTAWAKIQYAASKVQAGDTVSIMPGVYTQGTININAAGGTADNYITFQSYDMNNKAIIDGGGTVVWNIRVTVPYIRFRGLHVRNTASDGANIAFEGDDRGNPHFPIVEDSILEDSGQDHPGSDVFIRFAEGVLIQRNQMRRINRTATGSVGTSVYFFNNPTNPRGGHVVKGNSIIGSYRDGVGGGANAYWYGGPYINSYFYNNYIEGPYDDGLEIEGGDICVAMWGNEIKGASLGQGKTTNMGLGLSPVIIGPLYAFRNVMYGNDDASIKMGSTSDGPAYIYHNTMVSLADGPANFGSDKHVNNMVFRNNIIVPRDEIFGYHGQGITKTTNSHDYDLGYSPSNYPYAWPDGANSTRDFLNLAAFQAATGQESHGLWGEPGFVDQAANNYRLKQGSIAIDKGVLLPGFNDANSPWPYRGAGPDIGAYEYDSGAAANSPPVLGAIGNRTVSEGQLLRFTISATDPNNDKLTYSASNLPQGASFDAGTRTFTWTPASGQVGTYTNVSFQVSDGTLSDSENVTLIVQRGDFSPPEIRDVIAAEIGTKGVSIRWITDEPSTSQVEYRAGSSELSALDKRLVTNHVVQLTGLAPGTEYRYKAMSVDESGNLVTSDERAFSTLSAFTVSDLRISPGEVDIGEKVTISALVTNDSDALATYQVELSINDLVEATAKLELAAGTGQRVTFTTAGKSAGVFDVKVNGSAGSFSVREASGLAVLTRMVSQTSFAIIMGAIVMMLVAALILVLHRRNIWK